LTNDNKVLQTPKPP